MIVLSGVGCIVRPPRSGGVEVGHFAGEFLEFDFHILTNVEDGQAFVEDGAAGRTLV